MIESLAVGHLKNSWAEYHSGEFDAASGIVTTYRAARKSFEEHTKETRLLEDIPIPTPGSYGDYRDTKRQIRMVISNSAAAVAFLTRGEQKIPPDVRNKLGALLEQIADVQKLNPSLHTHLAESVKEHEATHYLASSALAAKSIDYILSQLPGDDVISKADFLVKKGVLKEDLKGGWVLTWKKVRNYYAHDLLAIPTSTESLSLVTAACEVALAYTKANLS